MSGTDSGIEFKRGKSPKKLRKIKSTHHTINIISKPPILQRQLFLWLAMVAIALAIMWIDKGIGLSLLWGFSVCMLPAACFTWYATKSRVMFAPLVTINNFYRAEAIKIILTAILFALVFKRANEIDVVILFIAFVVAQICSAVLVAKTLHKKKN